MIFYVSSFLMGVFSGGHCLGMCGPLVLALPVDEKSVWKSVWLRIVYNSGRVFMYTLLGALTGSVAWLFDLPKLQANIATASGLLLIAVALFQLMPQFRLGVFSRLHAALFKVVSPLIQKGGVLRFWVLGMLNGVLPCGMVAGALMVSIAAQNLGMSMLSMFFFGLGTFPLMLIFSMMGIYLSARVRKTLSWAGPLYAIVLGVLLLLRPALVAPHCVPQ